MPDVTIRVARADEHVEISELALRSKSYWGYSKEFLDACRDELTFDAAACASGMAWVAVDGRTLVGVSVIEGAPPIGELTGLFVDLPAIGTGCGRMLLTHTLRAAREYGFAELVLDADPGAESFYTRFGAERIGTSPSGLLPGRMLPHMKFVLDQSSTAGLRPCYSLTPSLRVSPWRGSGGG
jgi:GNAT superfamily N-acetyltransferase